MEEISAELGVAPLLNRYIAACGVLDYMFLSITDALEGARLHRAAALRGMENIANRTWGSNATMEFDESKLFGVAIDFTTFWGTDDCEPGVRDNRGGAIPNADGYKPAFFHPPYRLRGSANELVELFKAINEHVLGREPERAEIFSWSTDWSNYFDAGHEWWGAFYWTIRPLNASYIVVIGASSSD